MPFLVAWRHRGVSPSGRPRTAGKQLSKPPPPPPPSPKKKRRRRRRDSSEEEDDDDDEDNDELETDSERSSGSESEAEARSPPRLPVQRAGKRPAAAKTLLHSARAVLARHRSDSESEPGSDDEEDDTEDEGDAGDGSTVPQSWESASQHAAPAAAPLTGPSPMVLTPSDAIEVIDTGATYVIAPQPGDVSGRGAVSRLPHLPFTAALYAADREGRATGRMVTRAACQRRLARRSGWKASRR